MNNIKNFYVNLPKSKKIQFIFALITTMMFLVALPVAAWFSYQRGIVKLQKIQSPNSLVLSAAHREDSINFEINGINAEENVLDGEGNPFYDNGRTRKITHKDYVFSVSGAAVDQFMIQLAYTTNNPFTYEIYAAKELTVKPTVSANEEVNYVTYVVKGNSAAGIPVLVDDENHDYHQSVGKDTMLYYMIDESAADSNVVNGTHTGQYSGNYLNRVLDNAGNENANNLYHEDTYEKYKKNAVYTNVHSDAEPVYWQATGIQAFPGEINSNKDPFSRHFILRVKWNAGVLDNTTKETDILYITVKATG